MRDAHQAVGQQIDADCLLDRHLVHRRAAAELRERREDGVDRKRAEHRQPGKQQRHAMGGGKQQTSCATAPGGLPTRRHRQRRRPTTAAARAGSGGGHFTPMATGCARDVDRVRGMQNASRCRARCVSVHHRPDQPSPRACRQRRGPQCQAPHRSVGSGGGVLLQALPCGDGLIARHPSPFQGDDPRGHADRFAPMRHDDPGHLHRLDGVIDAVLIDDVQMAGRPRPAPGCAAPCTGRAPARRVAAARQTSRCRPRSTTTRSQAASAPPPGVRQRCARSVRSAPGPAPGRKKLMFSLTEPVNSRSSCITVPTMPR